jgi:4-alpha-glucanotransferase
VDPPNATVLVTPELARLAEAHGVAISYEDQRRLPVEVAPDAVVAVLAALGVDASSPASIEAELRTAARHPVTPSAVVQRRSRTGRVRTGGPALLRLEDGTHRAVAVDGGTALLPAGLPLGWHTLETDAEPVPVVVTPDRIGRRSGRGWGWMVQLYALQSDRSWGVGDLGDLGALCDWTAERDGALVLVNPLHAVAPPPIHPEATHPAPMQPSPYFPGSRRWTNPVYLRVEDTSAYGAAPAEVRAQVDALRLPPAVERIDRDAAWQAKRRAFELLAPYATPAEPDADLVGFATWMALCEVHGADWRTWSEGLRRPGAPAVLRARDELAGRVAFHCWLQQLCDEQLSRLQAAARAAGMDVGIVHDLAVGADPGGADAWVWQDVLATGARIGAPPDAFNQQGQDWGMPPWHPRRLAEAGYLPLRDLLRSVLRHAGGVRVDHVLGMFRLWWIPAGADARGGSYVQYDADAMLGVIALEAERAGAVVVGEDLGTVPDRVRDELADRGVLGSSVLWFERAELAPGDIGPLQPPQNWREAATASVSTHDLPTALEWVRGEHVRIRAERGLLADPAAEERSWQEERAELLRLLIDAGALDRDDAGDDEIVLAMHRFVASTPSRYVLAAPGDAVGDLRQPNLPGTVDEYPNWRLPVADEAGRVVLLDDLLADARVGRLVDVLRAGVR